MHELPVRPRGMPDATIRQAAFLDIDAAENTIQATVRSGQCRLSRPIHRPFDDGDEIAVAHAGNMVAGGERAGDEQVAYPPQLDKTRRQRLDGRGHCCHLVEAIGGSSSLPSRISTSAPPWSEVSMSLAPQRHPPVRGPK